MGYDKEHRPTVHRGDDRLFPGAFTISTAASTGLAPRGVYAFKSTASSSGSIATVIYTLLTPKPGDELKVVAHTMTAGSSGTGVFHLYAGTSACFSYGGVAQATVHTLAKLTTQGASFTAIALNATEWLVTGMRDVIFSTSTA